MSPGFLCFAIFLFHGVILVVSVIERLNDSLVMLKRGNDQLDEFYKQVKVVFDVEKVGFDVKRKPHPKPVGISDHRRWFAFTLCVTQVPAIQKTDALVLGQAIQCFRNSLDYLAWAITHHRNRRRFKVKEERNISFPMSSSQDRYRDQVRTKWLPGIPIDLYAIYERYQPYRHSIEGRTMTHLQKLSNASKHRIVVPTPLYPDSGDFNWKWHAKNELIRSLRHYKIGQQIKAGTKIMTVVLAGEDPHVEVNTKVDILPIFPSSVAKPLPSEVATPAQRITENISTLCHNIIAETINYYESTRSHTLT